VSLQISVAAEYCVRSFAVGVELIVTPLPPLTVTCPAPSCARSIRCPTVAMPVGTVTAIAAELVSVTSLPTSLLAIV
jgi:hypothetical protein